MKRLLLHPWALDNYRRKTCEHLKYRVDLYSRCETGVRLTNKNNVFITFSTVKRMQLWKTSYSSSLLKIDLYPTSFYKDFEAAIKITQYNDISPIFHPLARRSRCHLKTHDWSHCAFGWGWLSDFITKKNNV